MEEEEEKRLGKQLRIYAINNSEGGKDDEAIASELMR